MPKKKVIWIFNQYAIKPDLPGGTRHYDLAKELVRNGCTVHIFAGCLHYLTLKDEILTNGEKRRVEVINGITFHWLKVFPYRRNDHRRLLSMVCFYRSLNKEVSLLYREKLFQIPDIIIGSTVHLFTVLAAYKASKKINSHFVMEVRDLWPYTMIANKQISAFHPFALLFGFMERFLYRKSEMIVSLLEYGYEYIGKYTDPNKVVWIPNSFNKDNLEGLQNCENIDIEYDSTKLTILFAGSINENDNILMLVKAFERAKNKVTDIRLIIIGDGIEKPGIREYVKSRNLEDVTILPAVSKNKILCYLNCADILWVGMPDSEVYKYGLSFNKLFDYMAVRKPVLLSSSKHANMIREANCGIISEASNFDDLAQKIIACRNMDKTEREALGANGYNYLMNHYTTEIMSQKLISEVIDPILK